MFNKYFGFEKFEKDEVYKKIRDIMLQHVGKANAITSKEISANMGFLMEDTQAVGRHAILTMAKMYELPVISCASGYFIAENDSEIDEYVGNIQSRIDGMQRTRDIAIENYKRYKIAS